MRKNKDQSVTWHFLAGLLITEAGFWLLAFGELYLPGAWMHHLSYGGVFLVCLGMILLSWQKLPRSKTLHNDTVPNPTAVAVREKLLGEISVNGYLLEAYEQEVDCRGKQFRLRAFPCIDSEHEARYVRYLIHEGFIDQRWPRVSNKTKKEAGRAFFSKDFFDSPLSPVDPGSNPVALRIRHAEPNAQIWRFAHALKNSHLTGGQFDNIRLIVDNGG